MRLVKKVQSTYNSAISKEWYPNLILPVYFVKCLLLYEKVGVGILADRHVISTSTVHQILYFELVPPFKEGLITIKMSKGYLKLKSLWRSELMIYLYNICEI